MSGPDLCRALQAFMTGRRRWARAWTTGARPFHGFAAVAPPQLKFLKLAGRGAVACGCGHLSLPQASVRSSRRRILPTFDFGSASTKTICFGTL